MQSKDFLFHITHIRRYSMKYEVPVCEMIKFCEEDIITTSMGVENPSYGDTPTDNVDSTIGGGIAF